MPRIALGLLSAAAAAAAVAVAFSGPPPTPSATGVRLAAAPFPPLLGVVPAGQGNRLTRIDPETLRPRPGRRVGVGSQGCVPRYGGQACFTIPPWSFSPGGSRLAVARHAGGAARSLRVVDVPRMRVTADVPVGLGAVGLLDWTSPGRLLAIQEVCCEERQRLLIIDLARRAVLARRALRGTVQRVARTPREVVLLVAPAQEVGPARLAVADDRGAVRIARLERIPAGVKLVDRKDYRIEQSVPGLAVDSEGRRAFIVGPGLVAEVDLSSLEVSYQELKPAAAPLARLLDWLDPPAYAKGASGPTRSARWLGGGILAVSGADEETFTDADGETQTRVRPAGLSLVDTRTWTLHEIDPGATEVRVAGDLLVATGSSYSTTGKTAAIGLRAYGLDGARRFRLFGGREVWIEQVHDGRAYVGILPPNGGEADLRVVDLQAGRAGVRRPGRLPWLLLESAGSWWDGP
jgi:hypothetical protein